MLACGAAGSHSDKATEKARLRFAHAETVIPFTCLLGLFLEDDGNLLYLLFLLDFTGCSGRYIFVILAGILFKLDTYGFGRFSISKFPEVKLKYLISVLASQRNSLVTHISGTCNYFRLHLEYLVDKCNVSLK